MSFLVPAAFFLIFASIFQASSGDDLELRVALASDSGAPIATELLQALFGIGHAFIIVNGGYQPDECSVGLFQNQGVLFGLPFRN